MHAPRATLAPAGRGHAGSDRLRAFADRLGASSARAAVATDRRSTGAQLDDEVIEDKTTFAINERFKGEFHVNVTSFNGIVLLTGEVPAEAAKTEIGELVRTTPKVRAVQNELFVGPVSDLQTRSATTRSSRRK